MLLSYFQREEESTKQNNPTQQDAEKRSNTAYIFYHNNFTAKGSMDQFNNAKCIF